MKLFQLEDVSKFPSFNYQMKDNLKKKNQHKKHNYTVMIKKNTLKISNKYVI
jgi:hypothetical protein